MKQRKAKDIKEISSEINLTTTIVSMHSIAKKTLDFSTLKNKGLLKNGEKLLFSNPND